MKYIIFYKVSRDSAEQYAEFSDKPLASWITHNLTIRDVFQVNLMEVSA